MKVLLKSFTMVMLLFEIPIAMGFVLAQATPADVGTGVIGSLIGGAGGVAFAVWFGWYTTTKTIPGIVADFKAERILDRAEAAEERKLFRDTIAQLTGQVRPVALITRISERDDS